MSLLGIYLIAGQNSRRLGMSRRRDAVVDVAVLTAAHGLCAGKELQEVSAELRLNPRQVRTSKRLSHTWTRTC